MQIQLKQDDLESAVRDYILLTGIQRPIVNIDFIAGRGANGVLTEVTFADLCAESMSTTKPQAYKQKPIRPFTAEDVPYAAGPDTDIYPFDSDTGTKEEKAGTPQVTPKKPFG